MADVQTRTIDWETVVAQARGGAEDPVPVYIFGNGQKEFLDVYNPPQVFEKPISVDIHGVVAHLPDPDMDSTNAPQPATRTIGV